MEVIGCLRNSQAIQRQDKETFKFVLASGHAMVQGQINQSCKVILMFSSDFLVEICVKINLRVERQGKWRKVT